MNIFKTPSSKNISATLRIVIIERSELIFLLILYFHRISATYKVFRSSRLEYSVEKVFYRSFAKFTEKLETRVSFLIKVFEKYAASLQEHTHAKVWFQTKVANQLYSWNHLSAWVFPCKFAAYFQNNFS